jgi:NADH-quinone oxidoreductase subunit L
LFILDHAWIIPLLPAVAFWLILFFGRRLPKKGAEIGIAGMVAALVLSVWAMGAWHQRSAEPVMSADHSAESAESEGGDAADHNAGEQQSEQGLGATTRHLKAEGEEHSEEHEVKPSIEHRTTWFKSGGLEIGVGIHVDGLAVILLFVVTFISTLVHVFSLEYLRGDRRFTHYYAALSLFTSGMLVLVTASETVQMLFGWELMGLCSFMLIGHWWEEQKNSDAALKAFFTTRTGDIGLLVGMSILFFANGQSFNIAQLNERAVAGDISHGVLLAGAACLFLGVIGKSAQFPLHTWLPDAMAGPTPVSSLIHAATMVVAGVYLVARLYGVFFTAFSIGAPGHSPFNLVAIIGAITILIAAALAFVQDDIKKVLAYSTVSQLGYMVMALGVGAWTAAIFHLFTHAFFKCCLFLGAGSVSHSGAHHSFDMRKDMGGLRKPMPITFMTFLLSSLALAGVPIFAGFWSKDEILLGASKNGYGAFLIVGLIGGFMTACYMTRCIWLTFMGEYRGHHHPHESPKLLTVPLMILAAFSVGAGLLNAPGWLWFGKFTLNEVVVSAGVKEHEFQIPIAALSVLFGLLGIAVGVWYWSKERALRGLTQRNAVARGGLRLLENKYYLDWLYTDQIVGAIKGPIARAAYWVNQHVLDGVVNSAGRGAVAGSKFVYEKIDQGIVDGSVVGAGKAAGATGGALRTMQSGRVQQYAALMFAAAAIVTIAIVAFI